jgi:hypothetical protein
MSETKLFCSIPIGTYPDIAYALGFEYTTYFNNFFERMTNIALSNPHVQVV